jgi:O-acetyl-ADP-ribose deacetylase (regulator of RNase III)
MQTVREEGADSVLLQLMSILDGGNPLGSPGAWRRRLTALLTTRRTAEIPAEAWPHLHEIWRRESGEKPYQRVAGLPRLTDNRRWTDSLSLWLGDITRLQSGAIVNAANSGLTGCYVPFHACVDNAIHTAAGPWLREACERIMRSRGRPEPTGTVTVTPGFYLPASHVFHTIGPVVQTPRPVPEAEAALSQCYRACLEAARGLGLASLAFCAISTGIFGYPKREAASLSLRELRRFQTAHGDSPLHVVLVTFTADDQRIYREAVESMPE